MSNAKAEKPTVEVMGLNHAVLWVTDPKVSGPFYQRALGFTIVTQSDSGVFLRLPNSPNDHDLALFKAPAVEPGHPQRVGMYHLAWEVATLRQLRSVHENLLHMAALVGASDHGVSKSLYAKDPDGLEFEVMWQVPTRLVPEGTVVATQPLDLDAEIERFGADTPSRLAARTEASDLR